MAFSASESSRGVPQPNRPWLIRVLNLLVRSLGASVERYNTFLLEEGRGNSGTWRHEQVLILPLSAQESSIGVP